MMLMQAGQAGLYRRDSIWTDVIPPEMVAGATLWVAATQTHLLWSGADNSGSNVVTNGALLGSAESALNPLHSMLAGNNLYAVLKSNATPSGRPVIEVPAGVAGGGGNFYLITAPGVADRALRASDIWSATAKLIIVVAKVNGAKSHFGGSTWNDDALFNDGAGAGTAYTGLHYSDEGAGGGLLTARAIHADSGTFDEVSRNFTSGAFHVFTYSHQSNQLRLRIDGGAWAAVSSGSTPDMTSGLNALACPFGGTPASVELAHLYTANTAQNDGAISAVERWLANDVGVTPWW